MHLLQACMRSDLTIFLKEKKMELEISFTIKAIPPQEFIQELFWKEDLQKNSLITLEEKHLLMGYLVIHIQD